jgi:hypothetical protein
MIPRDQTTLGGHISAGIAWLIGCLILAAVITLIASIIGTARAHDHWISQGGYRGPINNEWCCGKADCFEISATNIKPVDGGYLLTHIKELVPQTETIPSEDGKYWRCQRPNGTRRCFFAPINGY